MRLSELDIMYKRTINGPDPGIGPILEPWNHELPTVGTRDAHDPLAQRRDKLVAAAEAREAGVTHPDQARAILDDLETRVAAEFTGAAALAGTEVQQQTEAA